MDPRTPILVGCGQITDTKSHPTGERSRVAFCAEAANLALEDTRARIGGHALGHEIDAVVVLPDHLHAVWTLTPGDADFSTRWRLIKTHFAKALPKEERLSAVRARRGERGIWQRRFWEHQIRDDVDYERHMDFIHYNPVKHGIAKRVSVWPYSTFHRYVSAGVYPADWSGDPEVAIGKGGE